MRCEEVVIDHPSGSIHAKSWNPNVDKKALLMHGWLDNSASFDIFAPKLAEQGYHVVAIDLAGHGRSFHREGVYGYRIQDFLIDIEVVLDVLNWKQVYFFCHSMGAALATVYTALFPQKTRSLCLFDAYLPMTAEAHEMLGRTRDYILSAKRGRLKAPRRFRSLEEAVDVRYQATPDLKKDACQKIVERNLTRLEDGFEWCFDQKLKWPTPLRMTKAHILEIDQSIEVPIRIYLGIDSPYNDFHPLLKKLVSQRDNFTIIDLDAGHYPHVDCSKEILADIKKYIV